MKIKDTLIAGKLPKVNYVVDSRTDERYYKLTDIDINEIAEIDVEKLEQAPYIPLSKRWYEWVVKSGVLKWKEQ